MIATTDIGQLAEYVHTYTGCDLTEIGDIEVFQPSETLSCDHCGVVRATALLGLDDDGIITRYCVDCALNRS